MRYEFPLDDLSAGQSSAFVQAVAKARPEPDRGNALAAFDRLSYRAALTIIGACCLVAGFCLGMLVG